MTKIFEKEENFIREEISKGNISATEIAKKLNVGLCCVLECIKRCNIKYDTRKFKKKYKYNDKYFSEELTKDRCYFLGLLLSDGCIHFNENKTGGSLTLCLQNQDSEILETFKKYMNCEIPIKNHREKYKVLKINNLNLANSLNMYGIVPNKTFKTEFPYNIENKFYSHFIRGVFDGDGSLSYNSKRKHYTFTITGTEKLLLSIQDILMKEVGVNKTKLAKYKNSYRLVYCGSTQIKNIMNFLYNEHEDLYIKRKYNKFKEML